VLRHKKDPVTRRRRVLDYVGSPISVCSLATGTTMNGKIISITENEDEAEITFSTNGTRFTIVRENSSGHWYEKSKGTRYKI
tara:strand:- start:1503 stop:1748 length:246 start_codon:yes stop_codon:yes gene_type:complete